MSRPRRRWGLILTVLFTPALLGLVLVQPAANAGHCTSSIGPVGYGVTTSPPHTCVTVGGVAGHGVTTQPGFVGTYTYACALMCDSTFVTATYSTTEPSAGAGAVHLDCAVTWCVAEGASAGVDRTANGGFHVYASAILCYFDIFQEICVVDHGVSRRIEK